MAAENHIEKMDRENLAKREKMIAERIAKGEPIIPDKGEAMDGVLRTGDGGLTG